MSTDGNSVVGTLIVRGALNQTYGEDGATEEWVTKTFSATFAIEDRDFASLPREGERVRVGPPGPPLDYWAVVVEVEQKKDGNVEVMAQLDVEAQREDVEEDEVSYEYEVLTFYGHAKQIDNELIEETRVPLAELEG